MLPLAFVSISVLKIFQEHMVDEGTIVFYLLLGVSFVPDPFFIEER